MAVLSAKSRFYTTVTARVTHADGSVTDHGVIATNIPWYVRLFRKVTRYGK